MPPQDVELAKKYVSKSLNSANANHEFQITFTQFKRMRLRKKCALTQVSMDLSNSTLDRINNTIGYIPSNVAGVRQDVNQLKGTIEGIIAKTPDIDWYTIKRMVDNTIKHIEETSNYV